MKKFQKVSVFFVTLLLITGCGDGGFVASDGSGTATAIKTPPVKKSVIEGGKAIFNKDGLLATSKENFDNLVKFATAGNDDAIKDMLGKGEVISVPKGVHVNVLEKNLGNAQVQITGSGFDGKRGFVVVETLDAE